MKKMFFTIALSATAFVQHGFAQDSANTQPSPLLTSYYQLKDALVSSNADAAATSASSFVKALNDASKATVKEESRALLSDATFISGTKDLKLQREKFAVLSVNMLAIARVLKFSGGPVYLQYCPMKKASWLSSNTVIKNPYYGNAMLTCGSVKETL